MQHKRTFFRWVMTVALAASLMLGLGATPGGVVRAQAPDPASEIDEGPEIAIGEGRLSVAAETLCLDPTADAYVRNGTPDTNYGTSGSLQVASIGDTDPDTRWSFLQFDLAAIPSDAAILSAEFEMDLTQSTYGGYGDLVAAEASWTGLGLTWNNKPSLDYDEYDTVSWEAGETGPQTWDVEQLVKAWVRGRRDNHGLAVIAQGISTPPSSFDSREATSGRAPQLCIEWAPYTNVLDPDGVGWYSGRNFSSGAFGDWFDDLSDRGFMMVDIEVDEINGDQRVGGVWQTNTDNRAWRETRNMRLSRFEDLQRSRASAGYRMIDQEVYELGGTTYYAGIWMENVENLNWVNYYNVTSSQFSNLFGQYADAGYLIIDVDAYLIDGELRYSAIWAENIEGLAWNEHRNLTTQQFSDKFNEYLGTYRMIDVESYRVGGQQYYAGIWVENRNGRGWGEYRGLTSQGFHEKWAELRDAGYRLIEYEVYPTGAGWRYAGIWRQNGDRLNWALRDDVATLVEDYFNDADLPGMSVAIAENGRFRYLRGLGDADVDDSVATDSRTVYRLASVSKAVAGALGVRLAQEGVLDLSASSRSYVPQLPVTHTHTVSQTLSNRGGIGHYAEYPSISGSYATALDAAEELWDTPLVSTPGTQYKYSTHAYTFAGASMEGAVDSSISEIIDDYLRTPFNLNTLRAEDRTSANAHRSLLYKESNGSNQEVKADDLSWKVLGGGMESSVYDLVRFGMRLTDGTILSAASRDQLWRAPDGLRNYALGWDVGTHLGSRVVAKRGTQNGARGYIRIYPDDDIVIAILTNRRSGHDPRELGRDIGALMLNAMSSSASAAGALELAQTEFEEPDDEGLPAEFVVAPDSDPEVQPTEEDLQEPTSDSVEISGQFHIYLPLTIR